MEPVKKSRRLLRARRDELKDLRNLAAKSGTTAAGLIQSRIKKFVESGTTLKPTPAPDWDGIQYTIDDDLFAQAEERAKREGLRLRDVILHG